MQFAGVLTKDGCNGGNGRFRFDKFLFELPDSFFLCDGCLWYFYRFFLVLELVLVKNEYI